MAPRLGEQDAVVFDPMDQRVFLSDAAGPDAGAEVAQQLGLSDAIEGIRLLLRHRNMVAVGLE